MRGRFVLVANAGELGPSAKPGAVLLSKVRTASHANHLAGLSREIVLHEVGRGAIAGESFARQRRDVFPSGEGADGADIFAQRSQYVQGSLAAPRARDRANLRRAGAGRGAKGRQSWFLIECV